MRCAGRVVVVALSLVTSACMSIAIEPARAWTAAEHRLLADSAMAEATRDWPKALGRGASSSPRRLAAPPSAAHRHAFLDRLDFGGICAWSARDDGAMARRAVRGSTVPGQLRPLTAARLDSLVALARRGDTLLFGADEGRARAQLRRLELGNPIACYLQHHLTALRLEVTAVEANNYERPGVADVLFRRAIVYEAIAQGYLADAFAAGHLMTPAGARPTGLDPTNLRHAHDDYSNLGAYVTNARGDAWQTFGDQLLLWYGPSFAHVHEAALTSLRELLWVYLFASDTHWISSLGGWADSLARQQGTTWDQLRIRWCASHSGPEYFTDVRMPTLMLLPTPAVATWSVRSDSLDEHGMRKRHHYPQLAEAGGHDPTLDHEDVTRLPSRRIVPGWMIPDTLFKVDPLVLVRQHPDFASVRFAQPAEPPPSYAGLLLIAGAAGYDHDSGGGVDHYFGVGYSPLGESAVLVDRLSVDLKLLTPEHGARPRSTALMLGASPSLPHFGIWRHWSLRWLDSVRLETGHAWTRGAGVITDGSRYALGLESPTLPVGFTYYGVTLRLGYQWTRLERPRRGLAVDLVLQ